MSITSSPKKSAFSIDSILFNSGSSTSGNATGSGGGGVGCQKTSTIELNKKMKQEPNDSSFESIPLSKSQIEQNSNGSNFLFNLNNQAAAAALLGNFQMYMGFPLANTSPFKAVSASSKSSSNQSSSPLSSSASSTASNSSLSPVSSSNSETNKNLEEHQDRSSPAPLLPPASHTPTSAALASYITSLGFVLNQNNSKNTQLQQHAAQLAAAAAIQNITNEINLSQQQQDKNNLDTNSSKNHSNSSSLQNFNPFFSLNSINGKI